MKINKKGLNNFFEDFENSKYERGYSESFLQNLLKGDIEKKSDFIDFITYILSEFSKKEFSNNSFISILINIDNKKPLNIDNIISIYDFIEKDGSNIEINLNSNTELFRMFLSSIGCNVITQGNISFKTITSLIDSDFKNIYIYREQSMNMDYINMIIFPGKNKLSDMKKWFFGKSLDYVFDKTT